MSLKFKRNVPIILMLVGVVAFLIVAMGTLPIVAY